MAELHPSKKLKLDDNGAREECDSESDLMVESYPSKKLKREYISTREEGDSESDLMAESYPSKKLKLEHNKPNVTIRHAEEEDEEDYSSSDIMDFTSDHQSQYSSCEEDDIDCKLVGHGRFRSLIGKSDSMKEIMEKLAELLKVHPLLVIRCCVLDPAHAYTALNVVYDPRGHNISVWGPEGKDSRTLEMDMEYLLLLRELGRCEPYSDCTQYGLKDHPLTELLKKLDMSAERIGNCIEESEHIYHWERKIRDWNKIHESLFGANALPKDEQKNNMNYVRYMNEMLVRPPNILYDDDTLWQAVTRWWESDSVKDKEDAEMISNNILDDYKAYNRERLLDSAYSIGDYLKLKFDVASKLGIVPSEMQDELKGFVLPGHDDLWQEQEQGV